MGRIILHCDCNSFFASVETVLNPEYRFVPMAVCGSTEDRHGIVLAKNDLAKGFGIATADTVYSAKQACPNLVIADPHYDVYCDFSKKVNAIYAEYTDLVEPFGIDESWLDVTASQRIFGSGYEIATEIKERIKKEIGITVSVGVSFNKVFAKLGSDYKKPDAITVIDEANFKEIVYPLPVGDLLFVGKRSVEALGMLGIRTIGDLARSDDTLILNRFGKSGEMMLRYARGLDTSLVVPPLIDDAKSVGNGFTFKHDLVSFDEVRIGVDFLSEEIGRRLRAKSVICGTVSVAIKDEYLRVIQRQRPLLRPTDISSEIAEIAMQIIKSEWREGKPIRTITITAQNLMKSDSAHEQIDMFSIDEPDSRKKSREREEAVDEIKRKFGNSSIVRCAALNNDIGIYDPKTAK